MADSLFAQPCAFCYNAPMPTFGSTGWWIMMAALVALIGVYVVMKKKGKI